MIWSNGDVSLSQTLTDNDHLYPAHINELRSAISNGPVVTVGMSDADFICTGTSDDVQIQAAIDSLSAILGGIIFIKPGLYQINDDIVITNPNVTISGVGNGTILKLRDNINRPVIQIKSTALFSIIENIKIDGNKANNTTPTFGNHGIYTNSSDGIYQNITFINCYNGGIWVYKGSRNKILNCSIDSCNIAIRINNSSNYNRILNNSITNNDWGVSIYDGGVGEICVGNKVVNNYIYNCLGENPSISLAGISVLNSPYTLVDGNTILDNYGRGIECFNGSYGTIISNNHVSNCGLPTVLVDGAIYVGMAGIDTGPDFYLKIINNTVTGCGDNGIWVSGNYYNIISGNHCINNGQNADSRTNGTACGILLNIDTTCSYNLVSNNYCIDNQGTATQQYGIREWQGEDTDYVSNYFIGNYTKGNTLGGILTVGATSTKLNNAEI